MLQWLKSCQKKTTKRPAQQVFSKRNWTFTAAPSNIYYIMFLYVVGLLYIIQDSSAAIEIASMALQQ